MRKAYIVISTWAKEGKGFCGHNGDMKWTAVIILFVQRRAAETLELVILAEIKHVMVHARGNFLLLQMKRCWLESWVDV